MSGRSLRTCLCILAAGVALGFPSADATFVRTHIEPHTLDFAQGSPQAFATRIEAETSCDEFASRPLGFTLGRDQVRQGEWPFFYALGNASFDAGYEILSLSWSKTADLPPRYRIDADVTIDVSRNPNMSREVKEVQGWQTTSTPPRPCLMFPTELVEEPDSFYDRVTLLAPPLGPTTLADGDAGRGATLPSPSTFLALGLLAIAWHPRRPR